MKNLTLNLIISLIIICPPLVHAKKIYCVVNVVDTLGRPIKDAEVSVWGHNYDIGVGSVVEQLFPDTKTDSEGDVCVRFEPNTSENNIFIFAQKAGYAVGWNGVFCPVRIPQIRVVLGRSTVTTGIVTDEANRPIAGAKVTAYPINEVMIEGAQSHMRWPESIFTTVTDDEGRFRFDCLAEWMEVGFAAEYPGRAYTDTSYNLQGQRLKYYKAGANDIHITMHPAGRIEGRILAKRDNKIEGIKLIARGERIRGIAKQFTTASDTEGHFKFDGLLPDVYLITTATAKDDSSQQLTVGAIAEVEVGEVVENVKIRMRDPIQLDVMVKDIKTNQPVRNALVNVMQRRISKIWGHLNYSATTDGRGVARVITLPGKCHLYIAHDNYDYISGEYLVRSTDTNLVMGLTPHSVVNGQVVYEDGRAAGGVEVTVSTFKTEYKLTGQNGQFSLIFSGSMAQRGFVIARDLKTGMAGLVDITENEGPVKVVLKKAATLKGRVVDPDNNPVDNARVRISYDIPYYMTPSDNFLYTNENGEFELQAVPYAQEHFMHRVSLSAYGYSQTLFQKIDVKDGMGEIIELPPFILKPRNMTISGVAVYEDGSVAAYKGVHVNDVWNMHGQPWLHSVTDGEGKFHFDGVCEGWLRVQCGSMMQNDYGFLFAKGGDAVTVFMNNNYDSIQLQPISKSVKGIRLPMYEQLTKDIEIEKLENKKLLVCFWYIANDESKAMIKQLTRISDEFVKADIRVVLLNCRPYSKEYASVNIDLDKKWIEENKVPFAEADVPILEDIMNVRRATGARFVPHMILTDENKIVTHEGFDVQWLQDNVL